MAPVINQVTAGAAVENTLLTAMTPSSPTGGGTITFSDSSGYTTGRQTIVIDRTLPNEEKILGSLSGTTFTIETRGYDGTVAATHTNGSSKIQHPLASTIVAALINHVDGGEATPHAGVLLSPASHDITARHTFGNAYGTPGTPQTIVPDGGNATGSGSFPSKEDHKHNLPAATAVSIGVANAKGVSASVALADHTHDLIAQSVQIGDIDPAAVSLLRPTGEVTMWPLAASQPFGWLLCNGQAVSRTGANAALFALIGTTYGVGDGSTTFNVPDVRGAFPFGLAASGTGSTIGTKFGTIDHTHGLTNAYAHIDGVSSGGDSPHWHRVNGVSSWTANIKSSAGSNTQADNTVFTNATTLGGVTDVTNPPGLPFTFIIKQ